MLHSPEHARKRGWAGKTKLGKSSHIVTSDDRTPQLPRFGSGQHPLSLNLGIRPRLPASELAAQNCSGQVLFRQPIQMVPDYTIAGHPSEHYASIRRHVGLLRISVILVIWSITRKRRSRAKQFERFSLLIR